VSGKPRKGFFALNQGDELSKHLHQSVPRDQQGRTRVLEADAGLERKCSEADLDRSGEILNQCWHGGKVCFPQTELFRVLIFQTRITLLSLISKNKVSFGLNSDRGIKGLRDDQLATNAFSLKLYFALCVN